MASLRYAVLASPSPCSALNVPPDWPKPGSSGRWRFKLHGVPMPLVEQPLEVTPSERLRSELRLALVHFDQTFTVSSDSAQPGQTRVSLKLVSPNAIPTVSGELDRFEVRGLAQQMVDETLRALREWCESEDGPSA